MGKGKRNQGGMGGGGGPNMNQTQNQGYGNPNPNNQPYQAPYNPYKPQQIPLTGAQRSNLRQQIIFTLGDPSSAFGRNSDTPCTVFVNIRDVSLSPDTVIMEFTQNTGEIPHVDRVSRLVRKARLQFNF